jgi:hypothetical protein
MNIFKVLASSRKRFSEEQASAMLAWLLNPTMEHGLGYAFLNQLCEKTGISHPDFQIIMRNNGTDAQVTVGLELNVLYGFIDVVLFLGDSEIISIENKIYEKSASNEVQLSDQYKGLKEKYPDKKINMVFLVPDDSLSGAVDKEYENLKVEGKDTRNKISWKTEIREIIGAILKDESEGKISPVTEYIKHTLKAFSNFIQDDFSGYFYEKTTSPSGINPKTEGTKTVTEIKKDTTIQFVGVKNGISGLLRINADELSSRHFQYTSENMELASAWIDRITFLDICNSITDEKFSNLDWIDGLKLPADLIYKIACHTDKEFFVGIKGGENALKNLSAGEVREKKWGTSLEKITNQWLDKDTFKKNYK